ncbi:hypothetical protein N7468_000954 [Penicillium chermesinum]|uniref:FAD dependent oxidoreductase domain-containing protein n=1 Tax=Penicillium chermesinum TaxID=63820 RepID=A0A9W9PFP5_9EURO|nr:uncharacterized protein N7468_000954 [Penicillium chermesinum]KAJ5245971.1 hypothetical protein N7468_000954 [Penicillium chermesinum]KAJ6144268.1 hypothetical protein N7470_008163 [Penicillium chermesinum]
MDPEHHSKIVIVGAGIIGLDVALVLAEKGLGRSVTVVAEYLPGDTASTYTSPWAGCNFSALSASDEKALRWDRLGYFHLKKLASEKSAESFVSHTPSTEMWDDTPPYEKIRDMSAYLEDFKLLPSKVLPDGVKFGVSFSTVTINAPKHLEYLYKRLRDEFGITFIQQKIPNVQSAFKSPSTVAVFNCTGVAAGTLAGVQDSKCYPTRGQVVLARAPWVHQNTMRHGRDYETYVIPRPGSNGNVILGGYMEKGDRAERGAQPGRARSPGCICGAEAVEEGGTRVEREEVQIGGKRRVIVHNYGAGGAGFQAGYGMAVDAVGSIEDILRTITENPRSCL